MLGCLKYFDVASISMIIAFVGLVVLLATLAFSAHRYLRTRSAEIKQEKFKNYHYLIDGLVGACQGEKLKLDSQIAKVYELRNYREYREVSIRILEGLKQTWKKEPENERLLKEIQISLSKLKKIVWHSYFPRICDYFTSYK